MDKFIFWGLFLALGLIVLAYIIWMYWTESQQSISKLTKNELEEKVSLEDKP